MAESMSISLLQVMDHLWYHQIILIPDPISLLITKTSIKTPPQLLLSESATTSSSSWFSSDSPTEGEEASLLEEPLLLEHEISSTPITPQEEERLTRASNNIPNYRMSRTRSYSTSPSSHKRTPKINNRVLEKSMSCRTFAELELEELKGFMDLGFTFKKESINSTLMSLIPGLQRLGLFKNLTKLVDNHDDANEIIIKYDTETRSEEDDIEEINIEEKDRSLMKNKPYLSEAWLIKRPDSPLLNLRVPRFSAAPDMKKHLKFWAKIVASEIHQET